MKFSQLSILAGLAFGMASCSLVQPDSSMRSSLSTATSRFSNASIRCHSQSSSYGRGQIDWPISGRLFRCYYRCCQLFSLGRSNGSSMRRSGGASRSPTCHLSARRSVGLRSSARPTRLAAVRIKTLPGRRDSNGVTATAKLIRDTTCGTRGTCPSCGACRRLQIVTNLPRTCLPVRCQLHYQPQRNQL